MIFKVVVLTFVCVAFIWLKIFPNHSFPFISKQESTNEKIYPQFDSCDMFLDDECYGKCVAQSNRTVIYPKFNKSQISRSPICHKCPYYPKGIVDDPIFQYIQKYQERLRGNESWGRVLDSGTGPSSLQFLLEQKRDSLIAVTATEEMKQSSLKIGKELGEKDEIIVGKWKESDLVERLGRESFEVIVADWLIGSVEFFDRYFQPKLIDLLYSLLKKDGVAYFTGLEPYLERTDDLNAQILLDTVMIRDTSILFASETPYREFPRLKVLFLFFVCSFHLFFLLGLCAWFFSASGF